MERTHSPVALHVILLFRSFFRLRIGSTRPKLEGSRRWRPGAMGRQSPNPQPLKLSARVGLIMARPSLKNIAFSNGAGFCYILYSHGLSHQRLQE
ncbi:hypothetical protein BDW62DRAFT_65464 [Aspergillus aurantiobrunneus]